VYPDAETFNPQRWLDPSFPTFREPLTQFPNLNGFSQFGFGRRTCQGIPVVEQDLFLTMGGMAWAFDIRKRRDPLTGAELPVHWNDYTPLLIAKPTRFPFDALPRSRDKVARMRDMFEAARERARAGAAPDVEMDISQFKPDLGDRIYADDVADGETDSSYSADACSVSSDNDVSITVCDSGPEPDLSFSDASTVRSDELESDLEREKLRVMMEVPLDPRLGSKPAMLQVPGSWN
jgi:hypothetical protein